ncbi:hypothetical protein [Paraburkholderia sp. J12]|uniref:hypothetical protein n=1 Tax=Paraburkholderia sp. J12 TaxID=2805432 RepID=UPI002ABE609D|nr:hypothetical protein [Paraburkholderia sp. J12]
MPALTQGEKKAADKIGGPTGDVKNNRESNYRIDPTTPSWRCKIKANLNAARTSQKLPSRPERTQKARRRAADIID